MILVKCSGCGVSLKISDQKAGRQGKCPKCGVVLQIPALLSASQTPVPQIAKTQPAAIDAAIHAGSTLPAQPLTTPKPGVSRAATGDRYSRGTKLAAVGVALGVLAVMVFTFWLLVVRDTWETDNTGRVLEITKDITSTLRNGQLQEGVAKYDALMSLIAKRQLHDPALTLALSEARTPVELAKRRLKDEQLAAEQRILAIEQRIRKAILRYAEARGTGSNPDPIERAKLIPYLVDIQASIADVAEQTTNKVLAEIAVDRSLSQDTRDLLGMAFRPPITTDLLAKYISVMREEEGKAKLGMLAVDLTWKTLPEGWRGNDIDRLVDIYKMRLDAASVNPDDEFQSVAQRESLIKSVLSATPLLGHIPFDGPYAIMYHAEFKFSAADAGDGVWTLDADFTNDGFDIEGVYRAATTHVVLLDRPNGERLRRITLSFPMSANDARAAKNHLRPVCIGRVMPGPTAAWIGHKGGQYARVAVLVDEIWIVRVDTNAVLLKARAPFSP